MSLLLVLVLIPPALSLGVLLICLYGEAVEGIRELRRPRAPVVYVDFTDVDVRVRAACSEARARSRARRELMRRPT